MNLTEIVKTEFCKTKNCPTLYQNTTGEYFIQGTFIKDHGIDKLPQGEAIVQIDDSLLRKIKELKTL